MPFSASSVPARLGERKCTCFLCPLPMRVYVDDLILSGF